MPPVAPSLSLTAPTTPSSTKRKRPSSPDPSPLHPTPPTETLEEDQIMSAAPAPTPQQQGAATALPAGSMINNMRIPATQLMVMPLGGFPRIHGLTAELIRLALTPECRALWDTVVADAAYVIPANTDAKQRSTWATPAFHQLLLTTLRGFLLPSHAPQLYVPDLGPRVNATTPVPFLLVGVPRDQLEELTIHGMWSTPPITFTVVPRILPASEFIMTLGGYVLEASTINELKIRDTVILALVNSVEISKWLAKVPGRHDNIPDTVPLHAMIAHIADRIRVSALTVIEHSEPVVVWRVYLSPHFTNIPEYAEQFIKKMKALNYQRMEGAGHPKRSDYLCGICHGRDHPTGLCEYKNVPGFFDRDPGPTRDATSNATATTAQHIVQDNDLAPNNNRSRGHFTSNGGNRDRDRRNGGRRGDRR